MRRVGLNPGTIIGGASDQHQRNRSDFYVTPPQCTVALFKRLPDLLEGDLWEPFCGNGAISVVAQMMGAKVTSTDLFDRGFGTGGIDVFSNMPFGSKIVSNPPFSHAREAIELFIGWQIPFALILKQTFWNVGKHRALFERHRPRYRLDLSWRPNMDPSRGSSPTMDFAWTVWGAQPAERCEYDILERPKP